MRLSADGAVVLVLRSLSRSLDPADENDYEKENNRSLAGLA
jgi:hypothetical protein